ncbi:MAG: hypothetical protein LBI68_08290, partial [Azoarcus sp.]|nr:hypothetical protein [Azoarcus sp.]
MSPVSSASARVVNSFLIAARHKNLLREIGLNKTGAQYARRSARLSNLRHSLRAIFSASPRA